MPVIAIDFGGSMIKLAIMRRGKILAKDKLPNNKVAEDLPAVKKNLVKQLKSLSLKVDDLDGIGISLPAIVNTDNNQVIDSVGKYPYLEKEKGFYLTKWLKKHLDLPFIVENDARAATVGEAIYGVGEGCQNMVMLILGTGIGASAIINGQLLRGTHYQAGILGGHLTVEADGYLCHCGNIGCLEAHAGNWNMQKIAQDTIGFSKSSLSKNKHIDFYVICQAARKGDSCAKRVVEKVARYWAIGIVNLIHLCDPEKAVLSGGLMKSKDLFWKQITQYVKKHAWTTWGEVELLAALEAEGSVLMGVEYLLRTKVGAKIH